MQEPTTARSATAPQAPAVPTTRTELDQLTMQRSELQSQLRDLTARRAELTKQRQLMSRETGAGHDQRIAVIDARSAQVEAQLLGVNEAITVGLSNGAAQVQAVDATPVTAGVVQGAGQAGAIDPATMRQIRSAVNSAAEDAVFGAFAVSIPMLLGLIVVWRGFRRFIWKRKPALAADQSVRLTQLQQSVDVIALEVERISESQRFLAKVMHEKLPLEIPANRS